VINVGNKLRPTF